MSNYFTIENRKIRVAIVGCGRISKTHLKSIVQFDDDLDLIALCDTDKSVLELATNEYNVKGYSDFDIMLNREQLDVVILCTPSGLHARQAIMAAQRGVHVVTEKPMATNYNDGVEMVKACEKAKVYLFVVKQNRYNDTLKLLKRAIDEDRFGKINLVHLNVFWTRPQSYYDQGGGWRGTWEFDGGAFMNQASHYVDLLSWLIGPVETVHAMMSTTRKIETEDTGVLNIRWRNGALGSMAVTTLTYPNNLEGSITILGDHGTVKVGGVAVNEIQTWNFSDKKDYDDGVLSANYDTTSVYGVGHPRYYKNFIDIMRGKALPQIDGRSGLKSLEILSAAYLSARDRKAIGLPLKI